MTQSNWAEMAYSKIISLSKNWYIQVYGCRFTRIPASKKFVEKISMTSFCPFVQRYSSILNEFEYFGCIETSGTPVEKDD